MRKGRNIRKISLPKNIKAIDKISINKIKYKNNDINYNHLVDIKKIAKYEINDWLNEKKIGIVFHIFWDDIFLEIIENLRKFTFEFDLYIVYPKGSPFEEKIKVAKEEFKIFNTTYLMCNNVGKDIGGKLTVIDYLIKKNINYDYLLFAHDKKSIHMKPEQGEAWRKNLYRGIFNNVHIVFNSFYANKNIKMVGPMAREGLTKSKAVSVHPGNYPIILNILSNFFKLNTPSTSAFIGGTMFWVEWDIFKAIFSEINIQRILNILEEGNVREPSNAHAMERIFGILVTLKKYKIGKI